MSREILCVMRMPPDLNGHGGSQRAWYLVDALRQHGNVHFVLIYRDQDLDCVETSLEPLRPLVASITRINISGWRGARGPFRGLVDLVQMRSHEAPRFSEAELARIASQISVRKPDMIFAGRLCSAVVVQALIDRDFLTSPLCVTDFDDVMSKFRLRQLKNDRANMGIRWRIFGAIDARIIKKHEDLIAKSWHGISVCTDEDVAQLRSDHPQSVIVKIPNVMQRDSLPPRAPDEKYRVLFTGNLGFRPNIQGLILFVEKAWPLLLRDVPGAKLIIVGLNPLPEVVRLAKRHGFDLHPNVPSLKPYYEACDVTIAPITFGSGTRIKILESMAYGRPVVSTSIGAEGMELENGTHLLLADTMLDFAAALIKLARDPGLRQSIADHARAFQQAHYGQQALANAMSDLVVRAKAYVQKLPSAR